MRSSLRNRRPTRDRILGILTRETHQIVFVDTPGIYRQRNALTDVMMKTTETASRDVDAFSLFWTDMKECGRRMRS